MTNVVSSELNDLLDCRIGTKIWIKEEKRPYKVRAKGNRYLVCTKPFNPKHTVLYTIIDLQKNIRGTENLVFGMGAETDEQCIEMVNRLESKDDAEKTEISHRNRIELNIEKVKSF